jgi:hypothetical protein
MVMGRQPEFAYLPIMRLLVASLLVITPLAEATPRAGFASYPRSRLMCSQHVTGNTMHITWSSHASKDSVDTIVKHYEKTTSRIAKAGSKGERVLEWDADHHLAVYPAKRVDEFPHCDTRPKSGEQSVLLFSNTARPK